MRRPLPDQPVFTREEARRLGWSDSALSRALASGALIQVRRGWLARPGPVVERHAAIAAARDIRGSVISHRSALLMYDLPVVGARPPVPEITVPPTGTGQATRAHLHRATIDPDDLNHLEHATVTTAARTVVDVGRSRPIATSLAALDAALHRGLTSADEVDGVLARCWNWPGIRRAQRAVRLADSRSESALESISRLVLGWLGLPAPQLQPLILDRHGRPIGRLDFYWDEFGVAGEADGRSKYDGRDVLFAEKQRQELLEDERVVVVRWGWEEATRRPHLLRARIESAFERGRARDRSGLPRLWSVSAPKPGIGRENLINSGW